MSISVFLSTVTDEFGAYRVKLEGDLTRHDVAVKVQERFKDLGGDTLDKLDTYVAHCDAVVHLVGEMCGAAADAGQQEALVAKYPDLPQRLPPLGGALADRAAIPYTQWEAWLALYHKKPLMIAKAAPTAPRGPKHAPTDGSRASQAAHLAQLKAFNRYPGCEFENPDDLAKHIALGAILSLLVDEEARARHVAEGFIKEMAKRVAGDTALDLDGMKQAVLNAIEIYEKEIAGRPVETNLDEIVGRALASAKEQVDKGQSRLACATLRSAAESMRREEEERRERYVAGQTALYDRERDIALASYDGEAAVDAIRALADAIHGTNAAATAALLKSEAETLYEYGRDRGSNVHLVAAIALRRRLLALASPGDARGAAWTNLGVALGMLGEREGGAARLEEAAAAFRAGLEENARERVPLAWATMQMNLGNALYRLGARESGTARLEQAVNAYRAALEEKTRQRLPLGWAMTQSNLGAALYTLGERGRGTSRLEQTVRAYRAALEEWTRERVPLQWAGTQNNLGNALRTLGEREGGAARLEEAVVAFRAALEECTRDRAPLDWAMTQVNLGNALWRLSERENSTARLEEAVAAYRAALGELTRERVPLGWAVAQSNLGNALGTLGAGESGTARLEEAVPAYRAALMERTRARVPLDWAYTQQGLATALGVLAKRQGNPALLQGALASMRGALDAYQQAGEGHWLPIAQRRVAEMEAELAEMKVRARGDG
jgi:tetratricopeptide (TPR) repeat protein